MRQKGGVLTSFGVFFILFVFSAQAVGASVIINEVAWMGSLESSSAEWIELYNSGSESVDLSAWQLRSKDGSPAIDLSGSIDSASFFLLERTSDESVIDVSADQIYTGALSNTSEYLELINSEATVVDSIDCSSGWVAGDNDTKATMSFFDGAWGDSLVVGGSPGVANQVKVDIVVESEEATSSVDVLIGHSEEVSTPVNSDTSTNQVTKATKREPGRVVISEIYPWPKKNKEESEFIELKNIGETQVDLFAWQIVNKRGDKYIFKDHTFLHADSIMVLDRDELNFSLSNTEESISLYKIGRKTAVEKINYQKAREGLSINCLDESDFVYSDISGDDCLYSKIASPGKDNIIESPNRAPIVDFNFPEILFARQLIVFDSSDCLDQDGDQLDYYWDFGDGFVSHFPNPDHTYREAGTYTLSLEVSDWEYDVEISKEIVIYELEIEESTETILASSTELDLHWDDIAINSILANPEGDDVEGEWIELVNTGSETVNLYSLSVDDEAGGSKAYKFLDNIFLQANEKYKLAREDSGLALNNSGDSVRLIDSSDQVINIFDYDKVREGEILYSSQDSSEATEKIKTSADLIRTQAVKSAQIFSPPKYIKISDLSDKHIGKQVKTRGIALHKPGTKAKQYFYIQDEGLDLQVYSYRKDFPDLQVGDLLEVNGEVSKVGDELRVKTKTQADMRILERGLAVTILEDGPTEAGRVLGEVIEDDEWSLDPRGKKPEIFWYIFFTSLFFVFLGIYFWKVKK